jgi:hypothetical protein
MAYRLLIENRSIFCPITEGDMESEEQIKFQARLVALETLVVRTYNLAMASGGFTREQMDGADQMILDGTAQAASGKFDPVMSDHIAAEVHDAMQTLLNLAKVIRAPKP